jgi:hypothetical protein
VVAGGRGGGCEQIEGADGSIVLFSSFSLFEKLRLPFVVMNMIIARLNYLKIVRELASAARLRIGTSNICWGTRL